MSYCFAAKTVGPLAQIARGLALPASLQLDLSEDHHVWALTNKDLPPGQQDAWAILPVSAAIPAGYTPQFRSVSDWLPGMTALFERNVTVRATASAEVSALWTGLAAPVKTLLTGDIGMDLDLGIQTTAQWQAASDCWWRVTRAGEEPVLRVRLCAARSSARAIQVKADAAVGLDQATRNSLAAILGKHRAQILQQLRKGVTDAVAHLPAPIEEIQSFLNQWLALPGETQSAEWKQPENPLLKALKTAVESAAAVGLDPLDPLTARLEFAAVRTMEGRLEASLTALFDKQKSSAAILDATFDFAAGGPELQALFEQTLNGNLVPVLEGARTGVSLQECAITTGLTRRQTFAWQVPFAAARNLTVQDRVQTAICALDDATGRVMRGSVRAESERRTRHAASLLAIEGAFAMHLGGDVTVHTPDSLNARFELVLRTNRPLALTPLLQLYEAGPADVRGRVLRMEVMMQPESIADWLKPQEPAVVSRRMQSAWRTLLPAVVDMDSLGAEAAAPLLVWASLPVSTAARRTERGVELNRPESTYWDWADVALRQAMVWNARTQEALQMRLAQTHLQLNADEARRAIQRPVAEAVFRSLLCSEAQFVDRLTSMLQRFQRAAAPLSPVESLRNLSLLLTGVTSIFHNKLTSVYGPETARALGPLLLTSASARRPTVRVTWSR